MAEKNSAEKMCKNMDYSRYYQEWLQLDVPNGEAPNYYEILGLEDAEPNLRRISTAVNQTLDRLHRVNGLEKPEVYGYIFHQLLSARYTLLDPARKMSYDAEILSAQGRRAWKSYQKPTFAERFRQISMISVGFALGCVIMFMMAYMVQRNPDGSIVFRQEARVAKPLPFTLPLANLVYRPSNAQDFRESGYAVDRSRNANAASVADTSTDAPSASADAPSASAGSDQELVAMIPDSMRGANLGAGSSGSDSDSDSDSESGSSFDESGENAGSVSGSDDLMAMLPDSMVSSVSGAQNSVRATEPEGPQVALADAPNRRNPLYDRPHQPTAQKEAEQDSRSPDASESVPATPSTIVSMPPVSEENAGSFSPQTLLDMLENVRSNLGDLSPSTLETFMTLQFQTCLEISRQCQNASVTLDSSFLPRFVEYALNAAAQLGNSKHFEEAFQLCDSLRQLGESRGFVPELMDIVAQKRDSIDRYRQLYEESQQTLEQLKTKPDDPDLNTRYAMWLWRETGSLDSSIPYLMQCKYSVIRESALLEHRIRSDERYATPRNFMMLGDRWWDVASRIKDEDKSALVREHALAIYRKIDRNTLSQEQQLKISGRIDSLKK